MVFVDQVVAVEHVEAIPRAVAREYLHAFILVEPDDILKSGLLVRKNLLAFAFCAADDLKVL